MADDDRTASPPRRQPLSVDEYFAGVRAGQISIVARALTLVESSNPQHQLLAEELLTRLMPYTGGSVRVGITGAPGAGKSTFIEALGMQLVGRGRRVAVLAIDPSSAVTGGSILGDKTRMPNLASQPQAYIRPSPTAGTLGGVARKTRESMLLCEAAGYDVVLIETVGVGQSETFVVHMTDCFLALMLPGAGDELQGIKRGLLELVDVIAVNKADGANRQAADLAARQYRTALELLAGRTANHAAPVLTCSALHSEGIDAVWSAVEQRYEQQKQRGELEARRRQQHLHWLWAIVDQRLKRAVHSHAAVKAIKDELERKVLAGHLPAEVAARQILHAFGLTGDV
jgi:LAO/AO transport system kinase